MKYLVYFFFSISTHYWLGGQFTCKSRPISISEYEYYPVVRTYILLNESSPVPGANHSKNTLNRSLSPKRDYSSPEGLRPVFSFLQNLVV